MKYLSVALEIVAAVLLAAALVAAYAGPLRFDVGGVVLTVRTLSRPLVAAAVVMAARLWLLPRPSRFSNATLVASRVAAGTLLGAGVIGWATYLSTTCGGADSYGYVSASQRLLTGSLIRPEPLAALLPFEYGISAACPLGYVPSPTVANASVPIYPLGLPALMAVATALVGPIGAFLVPPIAGIVVVAAVYVTARRWYADASIALLAAALAALHPLVFTYSIQPMSDVPAAAAFMVTVAALSGHRSLPLLAGLAAAATLLIRPALAPATIALALLPLLINRPMTWTPVVRYLLPVGCAIVVQALLQRYLYDNALGSGYGTIGGLFSLERLLVNIRSYGYWTFFALGPVMLGALFVGLVTGPPIARRVTALVTIVVALPYLFYFTYDHWETLRFLLPALVVATLPAAAGLVYVGRRVAGDRGGAALSVVLAGFIAAGWMSWLRANNVFSMPAHEARHRLAGELVTQRTPPQGIVLALQHSGSLRYYAGRQTLNWDRIPSGMLSATADALQMRGYSVFVLIDSDAERAMFDSRHGTALNDWLPVGQRRSMQLFEARRR